MSDPDPPSTPSPPPPPVVVAVTPPTLPPPTVVHGFSSSLEAVVPTPPVLSGSPTPPPPVPVPHSDNLNSPRSGAVGDASARRQSNPKQEEGKAEVMEALDSQPTPHDEKDDTAPNATLALEREECRTSTSTLSSATLATAQQRHMTARGGGGGGSDLWTSRRGQGSTLSPHGGALRLASGAGEAGGEVKDGGRQKFTGIYAADLIPGHYLRTHNGVVRGEELFARPDLERPWRSTTQQRHAVTMALKEEEMERWMRRCSDLRTELGNVRHDARLLEYKVQEKAKKDIATKEAEMAALQRETDQLRAAQARAKNDVEHQIRLLNAQHENEVQKMKTEMRLLSEKVVEQAQSFEKQTQDLKEVATREVQLMETRFNVKVMELQAELQAVRASAAANAAHLTEQLVHTRGLLNKVESAYQERAHRAEQNEEEIRQTFDRAIEKERAEKMTAQGEVRAAVERAAAAAVDADEITQRFKLWNAFLLSALNAYQQRFTEACPEHVQAVSDPRLFELPLLYTPRSLQHDAEAKLAVERIVQRLIEMEIRPLFSNSNKRADTALEPQGAAHLQEAETERIAERLERLRSGLRELEDHFRGLDSTCIALRSRLGFFSDDLQQSLMACPQVEPPPPQKVTFVCLAVFDGPLLWANHPEWMRTAMVYFLRAVRMKRQEYGAYECYSDGVCVLLALEDPIAACRLAVDVQEWLLQLPWPAPLLNDPSCAVVYDTTTTSSSPSAKVLFRGLRVGAAVHTGPCGVEPTAMPECRYHTSNSAHQREGNSTAPVAEDPRSSTTTTTNQHHDSDSAAEDAARTKSEKEGEDGGSTAPFRRHYYGRAVLQTFQICSLAQGGQVLVSPLVWNGSCQSRKHELVALTVATSLGRYAVLSLNFQSGQEENQTMELFQLLPRSLARRTFASTATLLQQERLSRSRAGGGRSRAGAEVIVGPDGVRRGLIKGLERLKNFSIAVGTAALERQHAAVREGLHLLRTELRDVSDRAAALVEKARKAKSQFHLLPPPEMVLQLNDLYLVLEDVAGMANESNEEMKQLESNQDELRASVQGVREYLFRYLADTEREQKLKMDHEVAVTRLETVLKEVQHQRKMEVEKLTLAVEERDQSIRKSYSDLQEQQLPSTSASAAPAY